MSAREQRAATRGATRGVDEGVFEHDAFAGDAVHVRRLDHVVEGRSAIEPAVRAGIAAPIIGEHKEDIESRARRLRAVGAYD